MEWLKKLLEKHGAGAELVTAIMDDTKDQNYIPKSRFDEVNESLKELKGQLTQKDQEIQELSKFKGTEEELKKKISDLEEAGKKQAAESQTKIRQMTIDRAIEKELEGCKYVDLLATKYDTKDLKFKEDGTIENPELLSNQTKGFKETTYKDFWTQQLKGNPPANTGGGAPPVNPLQTQLDEARKSGNTALVVALKRQMTEQQQQQQNNI